MTVATIDRLRAIAAHLKATEHADADWFSAGLQEYEKHARHGGLSLDAALGLKPGPGASPWWEIEARQKRDALITRTAATHFAGLSGRATAAALVEALTRYEAGAWRKHRAFTSLPSALAGTLQADLFALLKLGQPVTNRVIERLRHETPPFDGARTASG